MCSFILLLILPRLQVAAFVVPFENRPRLEHDGVSYPARILQGGFCMPMITIKDLTFGYDGSENNLFEDVNVKF